MIHDVSQFRLEPQKGAGRTGIWAYVVPLRYLGGSQHRKGRYRGRAGRYSYLSPGLAESHPEATYIMSFLFPRFFVLSPRERIETIVHELYHLHPTLRGDLRRFARPHIHHGPTPAAYQARVRELTDEAVAFMPALLDHPLILGQHEKFAEHTKRRLKLPRRVFEHGPGVDAPEVQKDLGWAAAAARPRPTTPAPQLSVVKPAQLNLFSMLFALAVFFTLMSLAFGQSLNVKKDSTLFKSPSGKSQPVGAVTDGDDVKFLRYSASRHWILVSKAGVQGWIPTNFINNPPPSANVNSSKSRSGPEDELGDEFSQADSSDETFEAPGKTQTADVAEDIAGEGGRSKGKKRASKGAEGDENLETFSGINAVGEESSDQTLKRRIREYDQRFIRFFSKKKAKLFDRPTKYGNRYGLLLPGDELSVIKLSKSKRWAQVRLTITGEEGWFPSIWIYKKEQDRLKPFGPSTLGLILAFGSGSRNLGFGADYFYNTSAAGSEESPRDRLEVGLGANYFLGKSLAKDDLTYSVKFLVVDVVGRYLKSAPDGQLSGGGEVGVSYQKATAKSSGFDAQTLQSAGLPQSGGKVGFILGGMGFLALSENFQFSVGVRGYFAGSTVFTIRSGANFRF